MHEPGTENASVEIRGVRAPKVHAIEERDAAAGTLVLTLTGEFDLASAPAMRERLDAACTAGARAVVLDLAEVTFVDSSALRELIRADAALRAGGSSLVLAAPQPPVMRLLELTRTAELLTLSPTVEAALARVAA